MTTGFYKERLAELSIPEMFDCSAEQHSSSVAMRYFIEGRFPDITYAELKRRVDAFLSPRHQSSATSSGNREPELRSSLPNTPPTWRRLPLTSLNWIPLSIWTRFREL
jgi:acyl-CoA synthetase (AMP-forming)/AMP-acid ligase II